MLFLALFLIFLVGQVHSARNCAALDFATSLGKCCRTAPRKFASGAVLQKCNPKNDKKLTKWANGYVLNKIQAVKLSNQIDLKTNKASTSLICAAGPFMNCLIEGAGFVQNGALNESAIENFLNVETTDDWSAAVEDVYYNMLPLNDWSSKMLAEGVSCPGAKRTDPKVNVSLGPLVLAQFFHMSLLEQCPDPLETNRCNTLFEAFYECTEPIWNMIETSGKSAKKIK